MRLLNNLGAHNLLIVKIMSEYLVFLIITLAMIWLTYRTYLKNKNSFNFRFFLKELFHIGVNVFVIPVGLATAVSEIISNVFIRQRPFVTMNEIKLLVPHGADGGMPSHHMVFMVSVATMVYFFSKKMGLVLILLSIFSGIARISAGIHYPSDVLTGATIAVVLAVAYLKISRRAERILLS